MTGTKPLPQHLFWLVKTACRQELRPIQGFMTAVDLNHYVMSWAIAYFTGGDTKNAYERLERVYRAMYAAERIPDKPIYELPLSTPQASCKSCNAPIYYTLTPKGKPIPVDINRQSHFLTCPHASSHLKRESHEPHRENSAGRTEPT